MKVLGIITTGGDAPGMNAAIRAAVRIAHSRSFRIIGFENGWKGLIQNMSKQLTPRSVGGILQTGGTILHTSRCIEFKRKEGLSKAARTLSLNGVDGLIVIGGNGSFQGVLELSKQTDTMMVGIPASIDNDVFGTDETIGFDTAVNTAVVEVDKIRDTAVSLDRVFIVEVMGKTRGFIALMVGVTVGSEIILLPEVKFENEEVFRMIKEERRRGKKSGIIVAAEGVGDTGKLAREIEEATKAEVRVSILGYAQRGGNPTARSRILASLFAEKAVDLLCEGRGREVVGLQNGSISSISLEKSCKTEKPLDASLLKLAKLLAT